MDQIYSKEEAAKFYFYYYLEQMFVREGVVGKWGHKKNELAKRFWDRLEKLPDQSTGIVDTYLPGEISLEDVIRKYINQGKPVILKGAAKEWGAVKRWSPEFFAERYGDTKLPFLATKGTPGASYEEKRVDDICREIRSGSLKYVKFSNLLLKNRELLEDFDVAQIEKINSVKHLPSSIQLFMGGANTKTTIHTALSNVTFVQVHGVKRWLTLPKEWTPVMNPLVDHEPQFMADDYICDVESDKIKHLTRKMPFKIVLLEAGDIYFNPAFLWHHVHNDTTSIGVAFRWIQHKALLTNPLLTGLVMLSQIPMMLKLSQHTKGQYFPNKYP